MAEYVYQHSVRQHEALWSTFDIIIIVVEDRRRVYLGGYQAVFTPVFFGAMPSSS